jgi:uncharacterized protein (DUF433 family)
MDRQPHIERRPDVMGENPIIKGTRLSVELIPERLGDGWSAPDLLEAYPSLRPEHLLAAQSCAAAYLARDESVLLERAAP